MLNDSNASLNEKFNLITEEDPSFDKFAEKELGNVKQQHEAALICDYYGAIVNALLEQNKLPPISFKPTPETRKSMFSN